MFNVGSLVRREVPSSTTEQRSTKIPMRESPQTWHRWSICRYDIIIATYQLQDSLSPKEHHSYNQTIRTAADMDWVLIADQSPQLAERLHIVWFNMHISHIQYKLTRTKMCLLGRSISKHLTILTSLAKT